MSNCVKCLLLVDKIFQVLSIRFKYSANFTTKSLEFAEKRAKEQVTKSHRTELKVVLGK